jgi:tetratricopeptide (TPR) repeat protein
MISIDELRESAFAAHRRGELRTAAAAYGELLRRRPDDLEVTHAFGIVSLQNGELHRAAELLTRAIELSPECAEAHFNRGNVLVELRQPHAALASYERALTVRAEFVEAEYNRANVLRELGRTGEALAGYSRVISLQPGHVHAHFNRALAQRDLAQLPEALASYEQVIALKPDLAQAHCNRGVILRELGDIEAALASYTEALRLDPEYAIACSNRSLVLRDLGRWESAIASCDRAIALQPDLAEAHVNRGNLLYELGALDDSLTSYDRALALQPHLAEAHFNRSMLRLKAGDYANGWREYEWRWQGRQGWRAEDTRRFAQPLWLGEQSLAGQTILLHAEQGAGDTLQFCRYAPLVAVRGARVLLEVPAPLARLLATLDGVSRLIVQGDPLPAFDAHCPLLSLPLAFKTTLQRIPATVPYLKSDAARVRYWGERLGERPGYRVGLAWSGGILSDHPERRALNVRRNIPLAKLAALKREHVQFISLQLGEQARSELRGLIATGWDGPRILDFTDELVDFAETAALIEQLDLVISVDTAAAHLAGALGKPVWILNRFDACWRWLTNRDDTDWYPTARLYRQARPGDWDGVIGTVGAALDRFCARGSIRETAP